MNTDDKLVELESLYNVEFSFEEVKGKEYIELATMDILDKGCIVNINNVLNDLGYTLNTIEAFDDVLTITYFKK